MHSRINSDITKIVSEGGTIFKELHNPIEFKDESIVKY